MLLYYLFMEKVAIEAEKVFLRANLKVKMRKLGI
jgi:hypothetical protein